MNKIGEEFNYYICNAEYSTGWNGELFHTIPLSLPQVIMDWSTVTTIGAGILDTIGYYTNYSLLSWSSPIGLPNIIWQNVKQSSESLSLQGVLAVLGLREGLEVGAVGYAYEIFIMSMFDIQRISSLNYLNIIVEKYGLESIKPLHDAGAKFSDLHALQITELVEKYGIEIKDKLLHPESIKDEIIADEILIESQKETSLIQKENIYYDTAEEIENTNTTDTYDTLEGN